MNRRIGLIALAVALALVGAIAVFSYAHNADKRAIAKTRSATVLISQKQIPAGTSWGDVLKGGYVKEEREPVDSAPSNALSNLQAAVPLDEVASGTIAGGQIIVRPMFAQASSKTGVLALPAGKIAVSVTMPANADVAGFVQSGSKVAIFTTFKIAKPSNATVQTDVGGGTDVYATKLLLNRIDVIATSQDAPSDVNGGKSNNNNNNSTQNVLVTLALSQQDAERLILSQQIGQLYLGLLSDSSVTDTNNGGAINVVTFNPTPVFVK